MPGHWELIVLAVVLLLLFGSKQVPQIARQVGRGVREMKQTVAEVDVRHDVRRALEAPEDEARAGETDPRSEEPRDRYGSVTKPERNDRADGESSRYE